MARIRPAQRVSGLLRDLTIPGADMDLRTGTLALSIGYFVFGITLALYQQNLPQERRIPWLAMARIAQGIGAFLLLGRGTIPEWTSVIFGNSILITGFLYEACAILHITGRRVQRHVHLGAALVLIAISTSMVTQPSHIRIALASIMQVPIFGVAGWHMVRHSGLRPTLTRSLGGLYAGLAVLLVVRTVWAVTAYQQPTLFDGSVIHNITYTVMFFMMLTSGFGILLLVVDRTQTALHEAVKEQSVILDTLPTGLCIVRDRIIQQCNPALETMFGFESGTLTGNSVRVLYPDDETFRYFGDVIYREIDRTGCFSGEVAYMRRSGERFWAQDEGRSIFPERSSRYAVFSVMDVTDRRRHHEELTRQKRALEETLDRMRETKEALIESETRHRILFTHSPDAYLIIIDERFTDCNKATELMMRCDRDQIIGRRPDELSPERQPDGRPSALAATERMAEAMSTGSRTFEWVHRRPDGEEFIAEVSIAAMSLSGQRALFTTLRDITLRKRHEETLNFIQFTLEHMSDAAYWIDERGRLAYVNRAACSMLGYTKEEFAAMTVADLDIFFPLDRWQEHWQNLRLAGSMTFESTHRMRTGELLPVDVNANFMLHGNNEFDCAFVRDITERKHAEQEITGHSEELARLVAEKDTFFSLVAHDLRSPFTSLLGFTELLAEDIGNMSPSEIRNAVGNIRKSVMNQYNLLENLLEWSRMQRGLITCCPTSHPLVLLLRSGIEHVAEAAMKKDIAIDVDVPKHLLVLADDHMVETVVRNLVSNAVKFTTRGGGIRITAGMVINGMVRVSIQDSGIGIPEHVRAALFTIDRRSSRRGTEGESSTGLGLIICDDFVHRHNGTIEIESSVTGGTVVHFTLPSA